MNTQKDGGRNARRPFSWGALSVTVILGLLWTGLFVYGLQNRFIYFASLMLVFFLPSTGLGYYLWLRGDRWYKVALLSILAVSFAFSVIIEFVAVYLKFWTFFTDIDPLMNLTIGDIPVEEFIFYFGANMQLCFLYAAIRLKCESMGLTAGRFWHWFSRQQQDNRIPANAVLHRYGLIILGIISLVIGVGIIRRLRGGDSVGTKEEYRDTRGLPVYKEGKWYPGWLIAIVPFVVIGIAWMRSTIRLINMPALLISVSLNVSLYLLFEYNAIMRGHWVYNEQRLIGWRLAGTIPLEQLLLYFVSFLFLVPFFECVRHFLITTFGNAQQKQTHAESLGLDRLIRLDDCRVKL